MKKILPVLLMFLMLLTLPVQAANGKLSATAETSGKQVTVTVRLDNPGIVATRIFVRYDSGALQLTDAKNGDVFAASNAEFGKDVTANPYTMLWVDATRRDNITKSGTLCTVTFAVKGGTENGKTSVRFAVDKSSTFDVNFNDVTVADCSCSVDVPVVTTKAAATQATTKPAATTTAKTPAATTTTTKAASTTASTAKQPAATTTKVTAASGTTAARTTTTTLPGASNKPETTTSSVASVASSAAAAASSVAEKLSSGVSGNGETKSPADAANDTTAVYVDEAESNRVLTDGALSIGTELQTDTLIDPEPPTNHRNLLWLLLLIPVAVVVILIVIKKKP